MSRLTKKEKKELKRQRKNEKRKRSITGTVMELERRRMNAKALGMVVGVVVLLILAGLVGVVIIHGLNSAENTRHPGIYFYVESAHFVNSSGSIFFTTTVKNTGSVFINAINITAPATGSTIGQLTSISVGDTASGTFAISGVTNGTLYSLDYFTASGNLSYSTMIPVMGD